MTPVCTIAIAVFALAGVPRQYRPTIELPADARLREAFIEIMAAQSPAWELLPPLPSVSFTGREDHTEELRWRKAGLEVTVLFTRYVSAEEASLALDWDMRMLNAALPMVRGLADDAYGNEGDNRRIFRSGAYVVDVRPRVRDEAAAQKVGRVWEFRAVDYATLFLAAMNRHLGDTPAK